MEVIDFCMFQPSELFYAFQELVGRFIWAFPVDGQIG